MPISTEILLFTPQYSPRLDYGAQYVLTDLLGIDVQFTTDPEKMQQFSGPKIHFTATKPASEAMHLIPHVLLTESDVRDQALTTGLHSGVPTLCQVPPGGALPFDPFAAAFYLLSRYEEYLPYAADEHDRFPAAVAWATRANCLDRPIVWEWALLLWKALLKQYPKLVRPARVYRFRPTYDVDLPWAFRYRGWRGIARAGLDLLGGQWRLSHRRLATWLGRNTDPFYTFPALRDLHERTGIRPRIFWLVANVRSRYDLNPSTKLVAFQDLIRSSLEWADSGLHPSYATYRMPALMRQEQETLGHISGQAVVHSRQHYLRLRLPHTYRQLLEVGIRHDYSMGFADAVGYRAGTSEPFYWFDLENNQVTDLLLHPFVAMDVALRKYQQLSPDQAAEQLQTLRTYCRTEGLTFSTLWHNSSFSDVHGWEGWPSVYEALFKD